MRTLLCLFRRLRQSLLLHPDTPRKRGQVIVIFAVTLLVLLFFTGLAIDTGMLYVTYGHLRRAIDGAAVAAANDFKSQGVGETKPPLDRMKVAALEVMKLHDLKAADMDLKVYVCDEDGDGDRDADLATKEPDFYNQCPDTSIDSARKLVWVDAKLEAPLYFLYLLGFRSVPLRATAIAEAAPIDLVIVIDTSESMAEDTDMNGDGVSDYVYGNYDPKPCNDDNKCQPMADAKAAANSLIQTMFDSYDHVAIVNFDVTAPKLEHIPMRESLALAKADVDLLRVRDDPDYDETMHSYWETHLGYYAWNPVNPEDRDGDGLDADSIGCTIDDFEKRWDNASNIPCDDETKFDGYNWDKLNEYTDADDTFARAKLLSQGCDVTNPSTCKPLHAYFSVPSTCIGCGIRAAADVLKRDGRPNSVWVIVFLSDGLVNIADTHATSPNVPVTFTFGGVTKNNNAFCNGGIGSPMWDSGCNDSAKRYDRTVTTPIGDYIEFGNTRNCIDNPSATCPPGTNKIFGSPPLDPYIYTPYDYALDMIDYAGLAVSGNDAETAISGSDTAIYAIGLGKPKAALDENAENLLRYMGGQIGDDGDRLTNECKGVAARTDCGQYYYASSGAGLYDIFNHISSRIYSRLTK